MPGENYDERRLDAEFEAHLWGGEILMGTAVDRKAGEWVDGW